MKTYLIAASALVFLQGCADMEARDAYARRQGKPTLGESLQMIATPLLNGADAYYSTKARQPVPAFQPLPCAACEQQRLWKESHPDPIPVRIVR